MSVDVLVSLLLVVFFMEYVDTYARPLGADSIGYPMSLGIVRDFVHSGRLNK